MTNTIPKVGDRVELIAMPEDPAPVAAGSHGTVLHVQPFLEETIIAMAWDNGRSLSLLATIDEWVILT